MNSLRPIFLAGPTAVGKSALAIHLAERLGGEILSVDSMQVYRGLDIGTSKPTSHERSLVRHHLIDVAELTESFDAAQFARLAAIAQEEIQSRGRLPIFCGGTGFYFKALLQGLGDAPPSDPATRAALEKMPLPELLCELEALDPITFGRIDRQNSRRVIRALEVIKLSGKPFSEQRAEWNSPGQAERGVLGSPGALLFFGLERERDDLRRRIGQRVERMFQLGLVAETEHLLRRGLASNRTALQAIGYRQVVEYLEGKRSLSETMMLIEQRTCQFAKRQMTWFKRQAKLEWIKLSSMEGPEAAAAKVIEKLDLPDSAKAK